MRPVYIYLNGPANSFSPWVSVDYLQTAFAIGLAFSISSGATLTSTVQFTDDDITQNAHNVIATQATTVITVTDTGFTQAQGNVNALGGHGLSVGDWVKLVGSNVQPTAVAAANSMDGEYTVATVASATQYTLTSAVSQTATAGPFTTAATARVYTHATLAAMAARTAGSQKDPCMAIRLLMPTYTSGIACLAVIQGMGTRS
jgi:hypothetical protein